MFGLPLETAAIIFGFPVFWIIYTIVFLVRTRDWEQNEGTDDAG